MIKTQIKSTLRNKFNKIYIVIFFVLFVILNIALNIGNMIDAYYDVKVHNFLQEKVDKYNESYKENEEWLRTLQITNYMEEQELQEGIEKIKQIKHVEDYRIKFGACPELDITYYDKWVIVDDWKNCSYVEKQLDKMGYIIFSQNDFTDEYTTTRTYVNIICSIIVIIVVSMILVCYKNILNNEKDNMKLLSIMGYTKSKIRNIKIVSLTVLTIIGYTASVITCGVAWIILK